MVKRFVIPTLLLLTVSLAACDRSSPGPGKMGPHVKPAVTKPVIRPKMDFATFVQGGKLFRKNCARCHGNLAQGDPNWRQPDVKGKMPPPPLNGNGHAWHHSREGLAHTIRNGTASIGGNMPSWKNVLTDKEIESILDWLQSRWSDETYQAWQLRNPPKKGSKG